jgi:SagB-type dehydrogenase family enzyme
LYVCARRVDGLPSGLYHYDGSRHRLNLLTAHSRRVRVQRYLPTQFWYEGAAVLVFFTAVSARYLWKYTYARAYRALFIEAGHQCQTFCLVATSLGLAPFCSMALADSRIEQDLGLDGVSESVLYAAGVGTRPSGMVSPSRPAGFRPVEVRLNTRVLQRPRR